MFVMSSLILALNVEYVVLCRCFQDEWASALSNIVHHRTDEVPSGVMSNLACNTPPHTRDNFKGVKTVNIITCAYWCFVTMTTWKKRKFAYPLYC